MMKADEHCIEKCVYHFTPCRSHCISLLPLTFLGVLENIDHQCSLPAQGVYFSGFCTERMITWRGCGSKRGNLVFLSSASLPPISFLPPIDPLKCHFRHRTILARRRYHIRLNPTQLALKVFLSRRVKNLALLTHTDITSEDGLFTFLCHPCSGFTVEIFYSSLSLIGRVAE